MSKADYVWPGSGKVAAISAERKEARVSIQGMQEVQERRKSPAERMALYTYQLNMWEARDKVIRYRRLQRLFIPLSVLSFALCVAFLFAFVREDASPIPVYQTVLIVFSFVVGIGSMLGGAVFCADLIRENQAKLDRCSMEAERLQSGGLYGEETHGGDNPVR